MHVITRKRLTDFMLKHPDASVPLRVWHATMKARRYANAHQVRADFPSADSLGDSKTVFDIGGNKYRLVVNMRYDLGRVYIRHVLTHPEYDRHTKRGTL